MSSSTMTPLPTAPAASGTPNQVEQFIEQRLADTQRQMQRVDLASALLALFAGLLVWLLAAALVDHWIVFGGLGRLGRAIWWLAMVSAAGIHVWRNVLPPIARRISPIYVAHSIEQRQPTLKNSLVNFLLLRRAREVVAPVVFVAIEDRAARDIASAPVDAVPDMRSAMRRGYMLAAVVGLFCLYLVLSPKNPLVSAARVLFPWAKIAPPTRVTITDVLPGNTVSFIGEQVEVSAEVRGLTPDELAWLHFSTADGKAVDQRIALRLDSDGLRRRALLPPGNLGLQQDMVYYLSAGDCRTENYRVVARVAPDITVESVRYDFPKYTGLPPRTALREGDLRAPLGTQVTIEAIANYEIQRAEIDLNCTGKPGLRMEANGNRAVGRFVLRASSTAPDRAEFESYQLRFVDIDRRENPRPIRHRIENIPDEPPEVEIVAPKEEETVVPLDGRIDVQVTARDPDFGLKRVAVRAEVDGRELALPPLLDRPASKPGDNRPWQGEIGLEPRSLKLAPGQRVAYWAEAEDNREPQPNRSATTKRWMVVGAPAASRPEQQRQGSQSADQPEQGERPNGSGGAEGAMPADDPTPDNNRGDAAGAGQPTGDGATPADSQENTDARKNAGDSVATRPADGMSGEATPADGAPSDRASTNPKDATSQTGDSANESEPIDPDSQAGDAIDRILAHRAQQANRSSAEPREAGQPTPQQEQAQPPEAAPGEPSAAQAGGENRQPSSQPNPSNNQGASPAGNDSASGKPGTEQQPRADRSPRTSKLDQPSAGRQNDRQNDRQNGGQQRTEQPPQPNEAGSASASRNNQSGEQPGQGPPEPQNGAGQRPGSQADAAGQAGRSNDNRPPLKPNDNGGSPTGGGQPVQSPDARQQSGAGDQLPEGGQRPKPDQTGGNGQPSATPENGAGQPPSGSNQPQSSAAGGQPSPSTDPLANPSADRRNQQGKPTDTQPPDTSPNTGSSGQRNGSQPQDAGSGQPMQGTADPQPGRRGSEDDAQARREAQMTQPNESPGAGQPSQSPSSSPEPQSDNKTRSKDPSQSQGNQPSKANGPLSPSGSNKESNSQGQTSGDQSGGGQQGGGQQAKQPGQGAPGSGTDSASGQGQSDQRGPGELTAKPGDQPTAGKPSDGSATMRGPGDKNASGQRQSGDGSGPNQLDNAADTPGGARRPASDVQGGGMPDQFSGTPGEGAPSRMPAGGGQPSEAGALPPGSEPGADAGNLEFARRQTTLALEHLRDQLARDRSDLIERLGWTPEEARRFLERWEQLQRAAAQPGPQQPAAKKKFNDALRSLGVRPRGTELRGGSAADTPGGLRENIRFEPPREWLEQIGDYQRAVAGQRGQQ